MLLPPGRHPERKNEVRKMEKDYREIVEVRTVSTDKEATKLLSEGWLLLATGSRHEDSLGSQAKVYFTLGGKEG